jgi:hypothetical protein
MLRGGRSGGVGRFAAGVGTQNKECRDANNDDADDDEDHERVGETGSLARGSGGFHPLFGCTIASDRFLD